MPWFSIGKRSQADSFGGPEGLRENVCSSIVRRNVVREDIPRKAISRRRNSTDMRFEIEGERWRYISCQLSLPLFSLVSPFFPFCFL